MIVPLVIYQGRRPWHASTEFADLLDVDPELDAGELQVAVPRFRYLLDDLSNADEALLLARPLSDEARVSFLFLSLPPGYTEPDVVLVRWEQTLATIGSRPNGPDVLTALAAYLWNISNGSGRERMREVMTTLEPEVSKGFVSIADVVRAEARAELLADQLQVRFGDLAPAVRAKVASAPPEQITAWSTRLIEGTLTLDDITD